MVPRHLSLAVLFLAAVTPTAGAAELLRSEQINRATGVNGTFGLAQFSDNDRLPAVITNDGRHATFTVRSHPNFVGAPFSSVKPGDGLWYRDIVANNTHRIASGQSMVAGLDRSEQLLSFITSDPIDRVHDTNGKPDLYVYSGLTRQRYLVSRESGWTGKAVGLTSYGTLTRGGRIAVFGAADGIYRRDLLTGRTTRIGGGAFPSEPEGVNVSVPFDNLVFRAEGGNVDDYVSADGRVVVTSDGILTPGGVLPRPQIQLFGRPFTPPVTVDEAGRIGVHQGDIPGSGNVGTIDLRTGQRAQLTPPAGDVLPAPESASPVRITPDGKNVVLRTFPEIDGVASQQATRWELATGKLTALGPYATFSRNLRFGVQSSDGLGDGTVKVALATPGNRLPGTVDAPAPNAYVFATRTCGPTPDYTRFVPTVHAWSSFRAGFPQPLLPQPSTVRIVVRDGAGTVVGDRTYDAASPSEPDAISVTGLGDQAYSIESTLVLQDGRTATSTTSEPATPVDCSAFNENTSR